MKNLLMIIIGITLLVVIIYKCKEKNIENFSLKEEDLYNGKEWDSYRIGDVVLQGKGYDMYDLNNEHNIFYHIFRFEGSIASEYLKLNTSQKVYNKSVLEKILRPRILSYDGLLDDNTLLLHVRVGDIMCLYKGENRREEYSKYGDSKWWSQVYSRIKECGIRKVIILSGLHYLECLKESLEYLESIKYDLVNIGAEVEFRTGKSPDDDILVAVSSRWIVSTGGGYGKLLIKIAKDFGSCKELC